jgi:hypothetical protein
MCLPHHSIPLSLQVEQEKRLKQSEKLAAMLIQEEEEKNKKQKKKSS